MMENGVREVKKKRIAAFAALCGPRVKTQWPRTVGRPLWADSGPSRSRCNGKNAQIAVVRRRLGERVKSTLCCSSRLGLLPCRNREKAVLG